LDVRILATNKKKQLYEDKLEPFIVPEDWEAPEWIKKIHEPMSWIPQSLKDEWWKKWREGHMNDK